MKAQCTNADDTASKKYETSECFDDPPSSRKNSYPPSTDVEGELQDGLCEDPPMYVSNLEVSRVEAKYVTPSDEESSMPNWESTRIDNETENATTNVDDSETCEGEFYNREKSSIFTIIEIRICTLNSLQIKILR